VDGNPLLGTKEAFRDFTERLKVFARKYPDLITTTLSNIFTMRLIGNKTHGDLAEIAMAATIVIKATKTINFLSIIYSLRHYVGTSGPVSGHPIDSETRLESERGKRIDRNCSLTKL